MTRLFVRPRPHRLLGGGLAADRPLGAAFVGLVPDSLDRAAAFETWLDAPLDCQTLFEPWDTRPGSIADLFDRLTDIWTAGRIPLLTWEPFTPTPAETPSDILQQIAEGEYDAYITSWAEQLRSWIARDRTVDTGADRQLYLRPMHEPNGDWYPWAPGAVGCDPSLYVRAWRRLHSLVHETGVPRSQVQWVWAVNHADVGDVRAEAVFPGEAVVDVVGIDGFNWGDTRPWSSWQAPAEVFGEMIDRMREIPVGPIAIPEFGCTSMTIDGNDPNRKNAWLRDAFAYFHEQDVVLAAYFDVEKETDWQVFGGAGSANSITIDGTEYQTYPGFRAGYRQFIGL